MKNNGLFSTLFIDEIGKEIRLDDLARGRMSTLIHAWKTRTHGNLETLWETFMKQALSYLQFVPGVSPISDGIYPLFEDFGYKNCIAILCLIDTAADIDEKTVGKFWPAKLLVHLKKYKLNWGILTNGATWRLYSTKSSRPFEDFVELPLAEALESGDEREYALFERFFHKDSFVPEEDSEEKEVASRDEEVGVYKCRLDRDKEASEEILDRYVKKPLLYQVDEVLQYLCNGFIADTPKKGEEYTEKERKEIFESAVKLLYRCLFFFYAEARRLLPSDREKAETYEKHSIRSLCSEAHKFHWGKRKDHDAFDLWQHLKGLVSAVNDGDPEYGIMGYNGGLFDDEEEKFLGGHKLRNDFLSRALYLLAYVEPQNANQDEEYEIPYEDLEVRHLGELYENILEYNVVIADAPFNRWMTKKGPVLRLESDGKPSQDARLLKKIIKGDVFFAQTALERKQTGSYYTPEPLVRFLNERAIIDPLREKFENDYRRRFGEFLDQARSGYDDSARRGATRSALALIERFVSEELLHFRVCDPAMGSGHFLVDTSNQMSGLIVELLAEIPAMDGVQAKTTSDPNYWRRLITRHCLYGVDLNPLAVNLARLSLWLNCFATDHRLTFIDHHLRQGNSLIGIRTIDQLREIPERKKDRKKKEKPQLTFNFDDIAKSLAESAKAVKSITEIPEDDTEQQKAMYDEASEKTEATLAPLADLFTAYLMDGTITEEEYRDLFLRLAKGESITDIGNARFHETWSRIEEYTSRHNFFHWAFAFPDVFAEDGKGGFNATVGNPPWDILKPNSQEFFSDYHPTFRSYNKQEANRVSKKLMADNPAIAEKWKQYCDSFGEQSAYFKEPLNFGTLGKGDINTFKLFLEQFFTVINDGGRMGIVVPSGIYTDQGCQPLRKRFFKQSQIEFLYCFENRRAVFNIHRSFKFVLFCTKKGGSTDRFKCAFMEHDPERLPVIDADALEMSVEQVKKFSPVSLNLMEFNNQSEVGIATTLYYSGCFVGDYLKTNWNTRFQREFHMTDDSPLFITKEMAESPDLLPLLEGKQYWILTEAFNEPTYLMSKKNAKIKRTTQETRVVYRAVSASTNERTFIPTVIPKGLPTGNTVNVCPIFTSDAMTIAGISSSFAWDWAVRQKVTTSLNTYIVEQLPFIDIRKPALTRMVKCIAVRACRLICTTGLLSVLWEEAYEPIWQSPNFWYPPSAPIDTYSPIHEQEIRRRLRDEAKNLTPKWGPHCGVHDRLPDRRDTGDRAQLRAEIDAYVAHLYGLSRDEFAYILDTFPVLKRKEEQAFGEYMSKRKCLEEYDRIATIL